MKRAPRPKEEFYVVAMSGKQFACAGYRTNHALGVSHFTGGWTSIMLLSGKVLCAFGKLSDAHAFNEALLKECGVGCGACDVAEFFERAGGEDAARAAVERAKRKALK